MMQEKAMVSDALNSINSGLKTYSDMIAQSENQELRSALQQMRNESEKSQYELYSIAKSKNYYQPAQKASQDEINSLKSIFSGSTGWSGTSGSSGMTSGMGMTGSSGMTGNSSMAGSTGMSSTGMTGSTGMGSTGMSESNMSNSKTSRSSRKSLK